MWYIRPEQKGVGILICTFCGCLLDSGLHGKRSELSFSRASVRKPDVGPLYETGGNYRGSFEENRGRGDSNTYLLKSPRCPPPLLLRVPDRERSDSVGPRWMFGRQMIPEARIRDTPNRWYPRQRSVGLVGPYGLRCLQTGETAVTVSDRTSVGCRP